MTICVKLMTLCAASAMLASCALWQNDEPAPMAETEPVASEQEAAYLDCLTNNQAMAVAWLMVEDMCRKEVGLEDGGSELPTP